MPAPTLAPNDSKEDELNRGQSHYNDTFNGLSGAEKRGTADMSDFEDRLADDKLAKDAPSTPDEYDGQKKLQEKEAEGDKPGGWADKTTIKDQITKLPWFKRKSTWIGGGGGGGLIALLVMGGGMLPAFLLPSISQNMTSHNDTRSTILERRVTKFFARMGGGSDQLPKSMLATMDKNGIRPVANADGAKFNYEGTGNVETKPYGYEFTDADGKKKIVKGADFAGEYKKNPVLRKNFKKAFNMRFRAYNGKFMAKNFFRKFGIKRDGGITSKNSDVTKANLNEKVDAKLKTPDDLKEGKKDGIFSKVKDRIAKLLKRSLQKTEKAGGDPVLTVGVVGCLALDIPGFIAGTVRAIQAAQLIVLLSDLVLSPAGAQQAGAIDGDKLSMAAGMLTETDANGKSALDSPVLQSAIGVNKNPINVSKYAPGLAILTATAGASNLSKAFKPLCNTINSPEAVVAVASVEAFIGTVATAGVGDAILAFFRAGGQALAGLGAYMAVFQALESFGVIGFIADGAYNLIKAGVGNYVDGARGQELGDALGTAAYAFYPSASLAGGATPLKTEQVAGFAKVMYDVDNEYREEDVATLSPFDISSPYTFLGSIVSKLSLYSIANNPLRSALSTLGYIFRSPFGLLNSPAAFAADAASNCNNAAAFDLDDDIAINPAGYPCVGIPEEYIDMSDEEVYDLVKDQLDPTTGEPKDDSDIASMMGDCSEGDLGSVTGCVVEDTSSATATVSDCGPDDGDGCTKTKQITIPGESARKRAAESLYMYDLQIKNMMSGEDNEVSNGGL